MLSATGRRPDSTWETVVTETPALAATSVIPTRAKSTSEYKTFGVMWATPSLSVSALSIGMSSDFRIMARFPRAVLTAFEGIRFSKDAKRLARRWRQ
ncbi:hypothetical protein GCM10022224_087860 [Nonomuraea antimicrobica]|uniref:Uncharacterized protein n=1 Tax=Nonomuraea antimicrobica TaxID=561173 RepID=A0ABP7DTB2_9ACTN